MTNYSLSFLLFQNDEYVVLNVLNLFVCIKLNFFLQIFFLYLIYSLCGYNMNKTRTRQPRIQF